MSEMVVVSLVAGSFNVLATSVAAVFAYKASKNSKPVSNGFTGHVRTELKYLRDQIDAHKDLHLKSGM